MPFSASTVMDESATGCTWKSPSEPSSSGFDPYPAFCRLRSLKASVFAMSVPPFARSPTFTLSAAGFIATSTLGWSPGVRMSWSAKWTWKPDTPGSEPAGARISAGKSGNVARSLPKTAVSAREAIARQLHPVAGVAGEPDHDPFEVLDGLPRGHVEV